MKNKSYLLALFSLLFFSNCKKNEFKALPIASITVANVVVNGLPIRIGSNLTSISNNSYSQISMWPTDGDLYVWPVDDSTHPYYNNSKFAIQDHEMYSLYVYGQLNNTEGMLINENLPYHADSTCGVRIINLSPNSPALNVTLSTTPTINEVSSIAFKDHTEFKIYPAKAANTTYVFQVRKAIDNSLITSYTLSTPRFANVTLVIRGLIGGNPALGITLVKNDR